MSLNYHNEVDRIYKGTRYIVRLLAWGYRCGYVQVSKETFNRIDRDQLNCHGGITYAEKVSAEDSIRLPEGYWLGFDCNHCDDNIDKEATIALIGKTKFLLEERALAKAWSGSRTITSKEVEQDCQRLIRQIMKMEEKYDQVRMLQM